MCSPDAFGPWGTCLTPDADQKWIVSPASSVWGIQIAASAAVVYSAFCIDLLVVLRFLPAPSHVLESAVVEGSSSAPK